jgi:hypothetical protein
VDQSSQNIHLFSVPFSEFLYSMLGERGAHGIIIDRTAFPMHVMEADECTYMMCNGMMWSTNQRTGHFL